ncbi:M23 family metallopeptidase [Modestobacter sp. SYSU DS0657]
MPQVQLRLHRASPSAPPRRRPASGVRARLLVLAVTGGLLAAGAGPAVAEPVNPTDEQLGQAQSAQDQAAAEVGRIAGLVAAAESELERVQFLAEAAGTAYLAAEESRQLAQAAADQAMRDLAAAVAAVTEARGRIAEFSRDTYMNGSSLTSAAALLDVEGPGELVRKAATLQYVADHQLDVLGALQTAEQQQAAAEAAARTTRDEAAAAEEQAAAAKAEAEAQLAAQESAVGQIEAQKAALDQQLQDAQVRLLQLQGERNAFEVWQAQKRAEEEAAARARAAAEAEAAAARAAVVSGSNAGSNAGSSAGSNAGSNAGSDTGGHGYVRPASGRTSSCYGARWGVTHFGVDIAAPIGTPIYAATTGRVVRAGPATGFGLAVYIRGDDGAVTVYGHVNQFFVSAGDRVQVGEQIAEVGNRGQSTGPHLHFEVHPGGSLYSGQVDPVPWLRARGVAISGC